MVTIFIVTIAAFLIAVTIMAVGVIFSGRCLRGSCGGNPVIGPDGEPLLCRTCPNRDKFARGECEAEPGGADCAGTSATSH